MAGGEAAAAYPASPQDLPEAIGERDCERYQGRIGLPLDLFGEGLRALVVGPPPLDHPRIDVHDPVLADPVRRIPAAFPGSIVERSRWREHLGNEQRDAEVRPFERNLSIPEWYDEEVRLPRLTALEIQIRRRGQAGGAAGGSGSPGARRR